MITVVVVRLVGRADWAAVRSSLAELDLWQVPVLLVLLLARQVTNALPLALFVPGVSALRATQNDLGAILMSMVAPPPTTWRCGPPCSPPGESRSPRASPGR